VFTRWRLAEKKRTATDIFGIGAIGYRQAPKPADPHPQE